MTAELTELINLADPLLQNDVDYITFVEIYEITRYLTQVNCLPSTVIPYLEKLLNHPRLTIGGYNLLKNSLATAYAKILDQWKLGQTAIGYEHNGTTVRLARGQKLVISLTEEADGSQTWQTPLLKGPLALTYHHHFPGIKSEYNSGHYRLELTPQNSGFAQIEISYLGLGLARKAIKPFILNVLIEESLPERLNLDLDAIKEY